MQNLAKLIQEKFGLNLTDDALKELDLQLGDRPIKKKGRILRSFLYERGVQVGLNKCYDIFASIDGNKSFSKYRGYNRDEKSKVKVTFDEIRQKKVETILEHVKFSQQSYPLLPQNLTNQILEWMSDSDENQDKSEEEHSIIYLAITLINRNIYNSNQLEIPVDQIYAQKENYLLACSMERLARNKLIHFNEPHNYTELFNKERKVQVKILDPKAFQSFS